MEKGPVPGELTFLAFPFQGRQIQVRILPVPGLEQGVPVEPPFPHHQVKRLQVHRISPGSPLVQHQGRLEQGAAKGRGGSCGGGADPGPAHHCLLLPQFPGPKKEIPLTDFLDVFQGLPEHCHFQLHGPLQ